MGSGDPVLRTLRSRSTRNNGNYTEQPPNLRVATFWFATATSGGNQRLQKLEPTGKEADAYVDKPLAAQEVGDANDVMYQWASSRDFDPRADLGKIGARLLAINSADDERNPPELGVLEQGLKQIPDCPAFVIGASPDTSGHGTTGSQAHLYAAELAKFLAEAPRREK